MTNNLRLLFSFLIISAIFRTSSTYYPYLHRQCCQDSYSPWRGQHNYRHYAHGHISTYRWPESTYRVPHYFFKPPLMYYHYDPCRNYMKKCHISIFYKCCYDCCNNLRCSVIYNTGYITTSSTTIQIPTTTGKLTPIPNTTVEETTFVHTTPIPSTTEELTTVPNTTVEETTFVHTTPIPSTTEELTTILNTTVEETTIVITTISVPTTTEKMSSTTMGSGDDSGDGPIDGSGDDESGSGIGSITEESKEPEIQRRHAIMEDHYDDFVFID